MRVFDCIAGNFKEDGDCIHIGGNVEIMVCSSSGGQVRLGIKAPPSVVILREELYIDQKAKADLKNIQIT